MEAEALAEKGKLATAEGKISTLEDDVDILTDKVEEEKAKVVTLEATAVDFKDQAVVEAGWKRTDFVSFPSDGMLTLATFCVDGPAVVEVLAQISLGGDTSEMRKRFSIFVDEGADGTFVEKAHQNSFDAANGY